MTKKDETVKEEVVFVPMRVSRRELDMMFRKLKPVLDRLREYDLRSKSTQ